ncbi:MAG: CehA/McbA family metallohydrolase [Polyangiales bacterium]|nr:CehA/McbA family metallohydrolase [Myxococcales bacterium]
MIALTVGVGIAGCATFFAIRRYNRGPREMTRAGVVMRVVETEERAPRRLGLVAARGDVLIESDTLRVVIAGGGRTETPLGAVLEASLANGEGLARGATLVPIVTDGEREHPIVFESFRLVERGDDDQRVALRLTGHARVGGHDVRVYLEYRLSDDRHALMISTQLIADHAVELAPALVVRWGGHAPYVPGHGRVVGAMEAVAPVVGADMRGAEGITGAAVFASHAPLHVHTETQRHGTVEDLDQMRAAVAVLPLEPDQPRTQTFGLVLSEFGLADAVRRMGWLEGQPFPEVSVRVPGAPTGTRVRLRRGGVELIVAQADARGVAVVPLLGDPDASEPYVVQAEAYGYLPSEPLAVQAGERVRLVIPKGGQVWVRLGDLRGTPLPARIRILGRDGTDTPNLGPDYLARGAGEAVVTATGEAIVPLPPGSYRVIVSHGPEWSIVVSDVVVTEGERPAIDGRIEHVIPPRGWIACDFHVHQAPSDDSSVSIEDRVATLVAEGISFAVPTDHNEVSSYAPGIEAHALEDFGTVTGVEVTTWDPNFGHFNAFPYPLDAERPHNGAPVHVQRTPADLFAELHATRAGMLVQVNHPRLEPNIGYFDLTGFDPATLTATGFYDPGYDLIEIWNGYDLARPTYVERVFQEWLALLEGGVRVVGTGNSDSHPVRYHWAGYPRTYVYAPDGPRDPERVLEALRAGRVFVTSGPFLEASIEGQLPGGRVTARDGEVLVDVEVRAPAYIDVEELQVFVGRSLVHTIPIRHARPVVDPAPTAARDAPPIVRYQGQLRVPIERDSPVVVRVRSATPMDDFFGRRGVIPMAFTNPIFVDADGDGALRWFPVVDAGVGARGGSAREQGVGAPLPEAGPAGEDAAAGSQPEADAGPRQPAVGGGGSDVAAPNDQAGAEG